MKGNNFFILILCLFLQACSLPRIIILSDPLSPEEHINLGVAYERKGDYGAAIKEYKKAARKTPLGYLYLGNAYFGMKDYEMAEAYYKRSMEEDPGNADSYNNLAWLYYTTGTNLDEAEGLVLRAIEINPERSAIYEDTLKKIRELRRSQR